MSIPNPNPNIADGIKSDNKTYSSNKIERLIASSQLPDIGEGDTGKVVTVGADGYELDPVIKISDTITITLEEAQSIGAGTIKDLLYNYDVTDLLPSGSTLKAIVVETTDTKLGIARQWVSGANKIAVSVDNATSASVTVSKISFKAFYI